MSVHCLPERPSLYKDELIPLCHRKWNSPWLLLLWLGWKEGFSLWHCIILSGLWQADCLCCVVNLVLVTQYYLCALNLTFCHKFCPFTVIFPKAGSLQLILDYLTQFCCTSFPFCPSLWCWIYLTNRRSSLQPVQHRQKPLQAPGKHVLIY